MIYTTDVTTLKDTKADSPKQSILKVTKGFVYKVEVQFPPGCAGLCHIIICDGGFQIWPSTRGETWHSDGFTIAFDDSYLKQSAPFEFTIYSYNLDEKWPHTVQVRIGLVSNELFMARFLPSLTYKYFIEALDQWQAEQRERLEEANLEILESPFSWVEIEETE